MNTNYGPKYTDWTDLEENKKYQTLFETKGMCELFSKIAKEVNVEKMMDYSRKGRPAIEAVIEDIEDYVEERIDCEVDLSDNLTKQGLGSICKVILEPYGFKKVGKKNISSKKNAKGVPTNHIFSSGSCYKEERDEATLLIIKVTVRIEYDNGEE